MIVLQLHPKAHSSSTSLTSIVLHFLADLDIDLEEFGDTSIEANRLALVQVAFSIIRW
jgi:hypothetical protein